MLCGFARLAAIGEAELDMLDMRGRLIEEACDVVVLEVIDHLAARAGLQAKPSARVHTWNLPSTSGYRLGRRIAPDRRSTIIGRAPLNSIR